MGIEYRPGKSLWRGRSALGVGEGPSGFTVPMVSPGEILKSCDEGKQEMCRSEISVADFDTGTMYTSGLGKRISPKFPALRGLTPFVPFESVPKPSLSRVF